MSEFSFSKKKTEFSSLLLSDLFNICFFILSHPLYFSYFIFFSPYLIKLLSFLSPLFITTFLLLLLVLLTVSPNLVQEQPKVDNENESFQQFEELEVYKIVFDTSSFDIGENPDDILELEDKEVCSQVIEAPIDSKSTLACIGVLEAAFTGDISDEYPVEITKPEITQQIKGAVKSLECFLQEKELENLLGEKEEKEVKQQGAESNKVEEGEKEKPSMMRGESKEMQSKVNDTKLSPQSLGATIGSSPNSQIMENSETFCANLGSFGSMRKEKEWRRTLACKLFEERHNVEGGEGMDMLWETYEAESNKMQTKGNTKKGKKSGVDEYNEDDDEDEEDVDGQLCCLQALKFSAGKMNLGMGRPNLVKISKALKGIGWLHNVTRHGKKGYH